MSTTTLPLAHEAQRHLPYLSAALAPDSPSRQTLLQPSMPDVCNAARPRSPRPTHPTPPPTPPPQPAGQPKPPPALPLNDAPPTSLDPQETNQTYPYQLPENPNYVREDFRLPTPTAQETALRHSGWHHNRRRVFDALCQLHVGATRIERFRSCGSQAVIQEAQGPDGPIHRIAANYCHDRFCAPCAAARAREVANELAAIVGRAPVRFITLTLKHTSHLTLREQITRLYASFTKLRGTALWKASIDGAVATLEVKLGLEGLWHPHLHVLTNGKYIDQKQLSHAWLTITGDSSIVDVRLVNDPEHVTGYLVKYVTKPADQAVYNDPAKLIELINAMRGRRLFNTSGTFRGITRTHPDHDHLTWQTIASLEQLVRLADAADPRALSIAIALNLHRPGDTS